MLIGLTQPRVLFDVLEWAAPNIVWRGPPDRPAVALTFDDGPHPEQIPRVLDLLRQHGARATFFLIGERAERHPELVAAIRAGGHELANHYQRDGLALADGPATFIAGMERAERAAGVSPPKYFRPPGGLAWPWQIQLARERGYRCVLGSAHPHDYAPLPRSYMDWLLAKNLAPGAIFILHDGVPDAQRMLEALPRLLAEGERRGLRFVPLGELLNAGPSNAAPGAAAPHGRTGSRPGLRTGAVSAMMRADEHSTDP